jgi:hypothetical protein
MLQRMTSSHVLLPPRHPNDKVWHTLASYLATAKFLLSEEHDIKMAETAYQEMAEAGEFALLNQYGDSLDKPPQS